MIRLTKKFIKYKYKNIIKKLLNKKIFHPPKFRTLLDKASFTIEKIYFQKSFQ